MHVGPVCVVVVVLVARQDASDRRLREAGIGDRASGVETGVGCDPCPACNVVSKPNISPVMLGLDKIALRYWTDELVTR
ncbi:hypothetical protein [Rhizobium sp. JAB6]|uniref:hypothetical protein n=1 Tax=Rhizobium sp. JAB6 TaxID=2127050 RepID=UPI0015E6BA13|nr:hypothetical protein [Rhizobium sp. JAB6]